MYLNFKLKLKAKINAHGNKKKSNPDDAPDHFLSAKRLHTRPPSCSTGARLVVATGAIWLGYTVKT